MYTGTSKDLQNIPNIRFLFQSQADGLERKLHKSYGKFKVF
jgi:hypothetical protein